MAKTIGQQLQQARQEKNLSLEKVVEATRIRSRYIEALEADDYEALPSPVQARAFLRIYAGYLGLSLDDLIAQQRPLVEAPVTPVEAPPSPVAPEEVAPKAARMETKTAPQAERKNRRRNSTGPDFGG